MCQFHSPSNVLVFLAGLFLIFCKFRARLHFIPLFLFVDIHECVVHSFLESNRYDRHRLHQLFVQLKKWLGKDEQNERNENKREKNFIFQTSHQPHLFPKVPEIPLFLPLLGYLTHLMTHKNGFLRTRGNFRRLQLLFLHLGGSV